MKLARVLSSGDASAADRKTARALLTRAIDAGAVADAGYALGQAVGPVPTRLDNFARAKLIVRTTLLHRRETEAIVEDADPVELALP